MDWLDFFTALGLVLVFEGIVPFLNPSKWKRILVVIAKLNDLTLRVSGLILMLLGLLLIYLSRSMIST